MSKVKTIKKDEILTIIKDVYGFSTKKEAETRFCDLDSLIEVISSNLNAGEKVNIGKYLVLEKKHVEAKPSKNGEMTRVIDGVNTKVPYTTEAKPEHDEVRLKSTKQLNK